MIYEYVWNKNFLISSRWVMMMMRVLQGGRRHRSHSSGNSVVRRRVLRSKVLMMSSVMGRGSRNISSGDLIA